MNGIIIKKYYSHQGSYGAQYDIGKLSFIIKELITKFKGRLFSRKKFDKYNGINIIIH